MFPDGASHLSRKDLRRWLRSFLRKPPSKSPFKDLKCLLHLDLEALQVCLPSSPSSSLQLFKALKVSEGEACRVSGLFPKQLGRTNQPSAPSWESATLCHRFSCECDKDKQRWIHTVLSSGPIFSTGRSEDDLKELFGDSECKDSDDRSPCHGCIFADIQEFDKDKACCVAHNKECTVPDSDAFICGVSCKDLSRQNPRRDSSCQSQPSLETSIR